VKLFNTFINWYLKKRFKQLEQHYTNPIQLQEATLKHLLSFASVTEFGKKYNFESIQSIMHFQENVPLQNYNIIQPYINRMMAGEQQLLWPTNIDWFAKSSGTTCAKSKFIPVSSEGLEDCHYRGGKDILTMYCQNFPNSTIFNGKALVMGGSNSINQLNKKSYYGDVSAVMMENMPFLGRFLNTPDKSISLMDEWEEKLEKMALATIKEDVSMVVGVPSWTLVLFKKIAEITGEKNINKVWPNLELYIHGGVSFTPYKKAFEEFLPSTSMQYFQTYNASEGFFALQDKANRDDMLLMLDYGIFYEFYDASDGKICTLAEVEIDKPYSLIISTNGGLWRYKIGDTISFTSTKPYRIKVVGRDVQFINAFGEEVIVDNADKAIAVACEKTDAKVAEYTAAPFYMAKDKKGRHEWIIEFDKSPDSIDQFTYQLDTALQQINSDYEAKRYKDLALEIPIIHTAQPDLFHNWLKNKGKLGGQHKVPRLANNRKYFEEIFELNLNIAKHNSSHL